MWQQQLLLQWVLCWKRLQLMVKTYRNLWRNMSKKHMAGRSPREVLAWECSFWLHQERRGHGAGMNLNKAWLGSAFFNGFWLDLGICVPRFAVWFTFYCINQGCKSQEQGKGSGRGTDQDLALFNFSLCSLHLLMRMRTQLVYTEAGVQTVSSSTSNTRLICLIWFRGVRAACQVCYGWYLLGVQQSTCETQDCCDRRSLPTFSASWAPA